jgi:lipid A 4'-phosphatase
MNRTHLIVVLLFAVVAGFLFALYPTIDLSIARLVYEATNVSNDQVPRLLHLMDSILRKVGLWIEIVLIAPPIIALLVKLTMPRSTMFIPGRAILFLVTSLIVGPGLVVNVGLKNHWERPRPGHLLQFGGNEHFVPWWQPIGDCRKNCSFVSGEASSAFWTVAPAALTPLQWRPLAYAAAIAFGSIISLSRIAVGGHFLSDVIFAGVFTFLIVWLLYAIIYRWKPTRLDDYTIEKALERFCAYTGIIYRRMSRGTAIAGQHAHHHQMHRSNTDGRTKNCPSDHNMMGVSRILNDPSCPHRDGSS